MIVESTYRSPKLLFNGHVETIYPSMFRKIHGVSYQRERLDLPDGDFVDLDWLPTESGARERLVIISHGLEGSSDRHYSKGMAKYFQQRGWDALAWNCRSCSGEINRLPRFYHHGDTADLHQIITHAATRGYQQIALVGFSMGGSFSLKYLGERGSTIDSRIVGGVGFSVPCHLESSARELDQPNRSFYRNRFLKKLGKKIKQKETLFPGKISHQGYDLIKTFEQFDNRYTAPLHGFENALDFYQKSSCLPYLTKISVPTLLVNAANDPFLPEPCYPRDMLRDHPVVHFEVPARGGHVGFSFSGKEENYMEIRAFEFLSAVVEGYSAPLR